MAIQIVEGKRRGSDETFAKVQIVTLEDLTEAFEWLDAHELTYGNADNFVLQAVNSALSSICAKTGTDEVQILINKALRTRASNLSREQKLTKIEAYAEDAGLPVEEFAARVRAEGEKRENIF